VDKPLKSVTHGQCNARPTVIFPNDRYQVILLGDRDGWIIIITIITTTMFMVLLSWRKLLLGVHLVHLTNTDWALGGCQPPIQDLGCESTENWLLPSTSTTAIVITTQPISWYSFYHPTKGGRLSRTRQCTKGAHPVPKAVYCSGCWDKCSHPLCDSNLGCLTPQSNVLTTRPLRHWMCEQLASTQ